ncbi:MAG: hypothetical protein OXF05_08250 [Hyphomicrobiales bacterium]|nr:hypothetical protein [Hyphomicrobiales bacterium]
MSSVPEKQSQNKKLLRVYEYEVDEDWLNANPEGRSRSVIRALDNEIDKQEAGYKYNYLLYLYLVFTAIMLNYIFYPQLHCNGFISKLGVPIQGFVFYMIAKKMDLDKRVISDASSFFKKWFISN